MHTIGYYNKPEAHVTLYVFNVLLDPIFLISESMPFKPTSKDGTEGTSKDSRQKQRKSHVWT